MFKKYGQNDPDLSDKITPYLKKFYSLRKLSYSDSNAIFEKYRQNGSIFYKKLSIASENTPRTIIMPYLRSMTKKKLFQKQLLYSLKKRF